MPRFQNQFKRQAEFAPIGPARSDSLARSRIARRWEKAGIHFPQLPFTQSFAQPLVWGAAGLLGLGFLLIYASMLPDQPTGANFGSDGGDFVAAMLTGGIPHPTGYPTYTLLGRLFLLLPVGAPYWRVALLSACCGALAVGLTFLWVNLQSGGVRWVSALTAALVLGSNPLFWSQAVIVEVHALQVVFWLVWLAWVAILLQWRRQDIAPLVLFVFSLLAGLSVGNHLTILFMLPALWMALLAALRRGMPLRVLAWQGLGMVCGASVYLILPWQALHWPAVNWGNPQTWEGLWWLVSAAPYRGLVFGLSNGEWLGHVFSWGQELVKQFSIPGLVCALAGLFRSSLRSELRLLLLWIFGLTTLFSLGYRTYDASVYMLPAYLVICIWIGQGLELVWQGWPPGRVLALALLLLLFGRMLLTRGAVDPRQDRQQAEFSLALLNQAPSGAIVLTSGDADSFPLWYAHFGLRQRPDLRIVVQPLAQYGWYQQTLAKTYPDLASPPVAERQDDGWAEDLVGMNPGRAVCRSFEDRTPEPRINFTCWGALQP